jgi:serine/threonine protein kinase
MESTRGCAVRRAENEFIDQVRSLVGNAVDEWTIGRGEFWCRVQPRHISLPEQGWKLHLSATPTSAVRILERAVPVLLRQRTAFKFAATAKSVQWLIGRECGRAEFGKFLTVYPNDDTQLGPLAEALHRATEGLVGPRILSDRPYRPESVVHYRYGGFGDHSELDNDGVVRHLLTAPDGTVVEDKREAWFTPPQWARCPLPEPPVARRGSAVLLGGHYVVRQAIRHSPKGGIYLAVDRDSQKQAVIKHARAHAESDLRGVDARDRLRHEAEMLQRMADRAPVPRLLELFEQDGDLFLAQERLDGRPLRAWVSEAVGTNAAVPAAPAIALAHRLIELVRQVHAAGVVIRDLSPTNVLVGPDDTLSLVDLELALPVGEVASRAGTPGYRDPAHCDGPIATDVTEDLYSLGALLFLLTTGNDPILPADSNAVHERLATWLGLVAPEHPLSRTILRLMAPAPQDRGPLALDQPERLCGPELPAARRLLRDGLAYLSDTMTPEAERLWPASGFGRLTDPGNVQHGAAGVLAVLLRTKCAVAGIAADWLAKQPTPPGPVLPGLYFGRAGVAWALAEAGVALADDALSQRAVGIATELPLQSGNPDVAHGLAGAGMAQLRIWQLTGEPALLARAEDYARALVASARTGENGPLWTVPATFSSRFAGSVHYGFAHGTAGIGYFLLAAGKALGRPEYIELATGAGAGLLAVADRDDEAWWWSTGPADRNRLAHWCNGSSGVGTFLLALYAATGQERFAAAAAGAAAATYQARWQSLPSACHGLAGNGQFLLDAATVFDEPKYARWARDLADLLAIRTARIDGRCLVADETGRAIVADYNIGLAGVLDFLHRLQSGGLRPWMLDDEVAR